MALGSIMGPEVAMDAGGSTGHSDQYVPSGDMVLRHQYGLRRQPRPWASSWPLVLTEITDIHTDPDVALGSSAPDATMALGISVDHPHLCIEF